jgi:molecular chaperone GrpE
MKRKREKMVKEKKPRKETEPDSGKKKSPEFGKSVIQEDQMNSRNMESEVSSLDQEPALGSKEELDSRINELEIEKKEVREKYLRTLAEFENFRRRNAQERLNWIRNANESLVLKLCEIIDDFDRAFRNNRPGNESAVIDQGMEAIYRKLLTILKSEGVTRIEAEEEEFDPMYHDAITYTPSDLEKDKVVSVIENGFIMNNKVIRPAKVILSSGEVGAGSAPDDLTIKKEEK